MLQHLLDLLLSAKSGVLAGVLLIGTTGALVTATVQNGVTTITITQASASPTGTASTTSTATASPTSTATASPSTSPSSSPSGSPSACADEAHVIAGEVQRVNTAFSKFHTDLEHMRKDSNKGSGKSTIENATTDLQQIREAAVKAIHATKTCGGGTNADQDKDNNEDQDEDNDNEKSSNHAQGNFLLVFLTNLLGHSTTTTTTASPSPAPTATTSPAPTTAPVTTFTGSDPKAIADEAIAAMQVVFDNAVADLASPTASPNTTHKAIPTARPEKTRRPDPSNKKSGEDHGGEGHD